MAVDEKFRVASVTRLSERRERHAPATRSGWLVSWSSSEGPFVDYEGNTDGPLRAATTIRLDETIARNAIAARQELVLTLTSDRPDRPIIIGLVQSSLDGNALRAEPHEVKVDGKHLILEAKERLELRCGKASLILTKDGKVLVRGAHISSCSSGVNRVRGGTVEIN